MSYYTGVGDYYSGKGDPGLFGAIGSLIGGAAGIVGRALPGPIGGIANVVSRALKPRSPSLPVAPPRFTGGATPRISRPAFPVPGFQGAAQRLIPGGASGYGCAPGSACGPGFHLDKTEGVKCVRNRRTNYTNSRALSRATKRLDGFVVVARRALKATKYKVVADSYKQNWRKPLKK